MDIISTGKPNQEDLSSIFNSKCSQLEATLYRFFEKFQIIMERLFDHEAEAFEHIHQFDNHLNQIKVCQKVDTAELPSNLNEFVKDNLLTKIYLKLLWYIDKLRKVEESCKQDAKTISTMSFECICKINQIPGILLESKSSQSDISQNYELDKIHSSTEKSINSYLICFDEIQKPTSKRISLAQLLEYTSKIDIILSEYVSQMQDGLKALSNFTSDRQSSQRKHKSNDSFVECPNVISEFYPLEINDDDDSNEESNSSTHKIDKEKTVGKLAFMISKQSIVNPRTNSSDNSNENEYETKQGKELKTAFTFTLKHKVEIQQILFETAYFTQHFKDNKSSLKSSKNKN